MLTKGQQYYEEWLAEGAQHGAFTAIARRHGVGESTVRKLVRREQKKLGVDPRIAAGMAAMDLDTPPDGAWVKSHKQDEHGLTYSFYVNLKREEEERESVAEQVAAVLSNIPAVRLPTKKDEAGGFNKKAIIPINDLHAGARAWGKETGYGDWDLHIATERLKDWAGRLLLRMPVVDEVILFYNGDTLHANGKEPMTPASGHVLDTDGRFFKAVDMTATAMVVVGDLAAQKHKHVRIVIKRGNHDEDSYIALLMAMKYRYRDQKNVTVEEQASCITEPDAYGAYWGNSAQLQAIIYDKEKGEVERYTVKP